jgi:hypothetical protein
MGYWRGDGWRRYLRRRNGRRQEQDRQRDDRGLLCVHGDVLPHFIYMVSAFFKALQIVPLAIGSAAIGMICQPSFNTFHNFLYARLDEIADAQN